MSRDRRSQTRPVSQAESIQHVRKAQQYLASAAAALQSEAFDACAGNAVLATMDAADAVAGVLLGERWQGAHESAANHVARAGEDGVAIGRQLRRVIRWKSRAHYEAVPVARSEAVDLLRAAERAVAIAERVVARPA